MEEAKTKASGLLRWWGEHFQKVSLLLGVIAQWEWMVLQQELCIGAGPWEQDKCKSTWEGISVCVPRCLKQLGLNSALL